MLEFFLVLLVLLVAAAILLLILLLQRVAQPSPAPPDRTPEMLGQLSAIERLTGAQLGQMRGELAVQRDELGQSLGRHQQGLTHTLELQRRALEGVRESMEQRLGLFAEGMVKIAAETRAEQQRATQLLAKTLSEGATQNRAEDRKANDAIALHLRDRLGEMAQRLDKLSQTMTLEATASRRTLEQKMADLQQSNETRLEQMRATVDEKLHATLEARLGQSFALVSERLELVQKGLGEMKSLADGVGDLKKVMSNVRTRGTWGEVQLRALIEDVLRPEEFVANFAPRRSGERVEFAVRLPGPGQERDIYLPIDSKFPVEDYQRLVDAQDAGDADGAKAAGKALEDRIKGCAKDVRDKYLEPGITTEYALLFLPFEGLYAEVLRRPGLVELLQREYRVAVCGPTTLAAVLNSLRMGFRAVAIQKRSGDSAGLLGAVKTEFSNFGKVIDNVGSRLRQAQDDIEKVGVRTRAINRKLREVEALPEGEAQLLLPGNSADDDIV
jgi:DNA recombination protein RmuC